MNKKTIKFLFILLIIIGSLFIYNKAYATSNVEEIPLEILDSNGNCITIMPPESGGLNGYIDSSLKYENCKYELYLPMDKYEETITISGLGTFHKDTNSYIADIVDTSVLTTGKFQTIDFELKNLETQQNDKFRAYLLCFKDRFTNNGNLSVNGIELIKNGKLLLEFDNNEKYLKNSYGCIVYDRVYNTLRINDYNVKSIKYENMGKDFTISISENINGKCITKEEHPYTGIKLESNGTISDRDVIVADKVTEKNTLEKVDSALGKEHQKLQVYDISLENDRKKVQPNGKVEISIPIQNNLENSKLVVYRIADDGTKTEYKITINSEDDKKYATFETDHFSTYVLAEKVIEVQKEEKENSNSIEEKQEEQKQENKEQHILDNEPKTGVTSNIKIIISIIAVITITGLIYYKKYYNKGV